MADNIRLINPIPGQPAQGVQQSPGAVGTGQGSALLAGLHPGTTLTGFIVNRDASGNPILRTPTGDIAFQSSFFLKIGSEVVIRVESPGGNTLAHILSVDGQPPEIAATLSAFTQEPDVIVSQSLANPAATTTPTAATNNPEPQPAITVNGTLISTPANAPSPAGTQVALKLVTIAAPANTPAATPAITTTATTPSQPNPAFYATYAKAAGTPAPLGILAAQPQNTSPQTSTAIPPAEPPVISPVAQPPAATPTPAAQITTAEPQTTAPAMQTATAPAAVTATTTTATPTPTASGAVTSVIQNPVPAQTPTQNITAPPAQQENTASATPPLPSSSHPLISSSSTPIQPGQTITGTIIGHEPSGESLVQTDSGVIRLQANAPLPTGSKVTFEVSQVTPPDEQTTSPAPALTPTSTPITELARQWTSLQTIFSLLQTRATATGQDFAPASIPFISSSQAEAPQPNMTLQNLPTGLMLFVAALKGNDFRNWLGRDNAQWLESQGHDALIAKASGEFTLLARQFTEAQPGHWQTLFFPTIIGGELQQARLFVKRDRKQEKNQPGKKNEDTRFVVEVDLSQLGEMQMDGFVRKREAEVQFDMVIRSLSSLPQQMQQDIAEIYNSAGEITGFKGSLAFQHVREFPVNPMEEVVAHAMKSVVA